tara:strand:- start:565 stop:1125 length:561 start_codon:yes stop_codon:yes gene_type:complete
MANFISRFKKMKIIKTKFKGLLIIKGIRHKDKRGYLREIVVEKKIKQKFKFQITSVSKKKVLRGLHFQIKKSQGKLISVIKGEIYDVAVDLRKKSPTFGKYFSIKLSDKNCTSVFIPPGFAHGFLTLKKENIVCYSCTEYRSPKDERSLYFNDSKLKIKWPIKNPLVSKKDTNANNFDFYLNNLFS